MRALLIYPDSPSEIIGWGDLGAIAEPLALEYLAAGAIQDGHDVAILDLRLHPADLTPTLERVEPDIVGVTGYSMHVLRNLEILREVKRTLPGCLTVTGGHHATLLPEDFFEPEVDFVVTGEGVAPFRALLRALDHGGSRPSIAGVWSRNGQGRFESGGPPAPFDVDTMPVPDRSLIPGDRASYYIDWMQPIALMRNTVGCPYRCNFCSLWRIADGRYYKRDLDAVVAELQTIPEDYVFFVDDEAFVDGGRMAALADRIRATGIQKRYFTYCRIDTLLRQPELMTTWRSIGLERLFIGIEAVSARLLDDYNKRIRLSQVEAGLAAARDMGIEVFAGFIVDVRFTRKDFQRLIRFIEHHRVSYPSFTIWTPLPGTDALQNFDRVIVRQPNGRPDWSRFDLQHAVVETQLPLADFMDEFRGLHRVFAGSITRHRDRRPAPAPH